MPQGAARVQPAAVQAVAAPDQAARQVPARAVAAVQQRRVAAHAARAPPGLQVVVQLGQLHVEGARRLRAAQLRHCAWAPLVMLASASLGVFCVHSQAPGRGPVWPALLKKVERSLQTALAW